MEAPLGNVAQITDDRRYILSQRVVLFKVKQLIESNYFKYCLINDAFQHALFINSTGSTATGIQQKKLMKILLPIPLDKDEQSRIVAVLSNVDGVLEKERSYKQKLLSLKQGLVNDLLSGKVRVNTLLN
jgi:type I restriction enzyme S subunit